MHLPFGLLFTIKLHYSAQIGQKMRYDMNIVKVKEQI